MSRYAHEYKRHERDFYPTPPEVIDVLLRHLEPATEFVEPCAGDYRLANYLQQHGHNCIDAYDIYPQSELVRQADALSEKPCGFVITNPPWDRKLLHAMIEQFDECWLCFDANWMHTKQAIPFLPRLRKIVSIGRVKWTGTKPGKDDVCWYKFSRTEGPCEYVGRG